MNLLRGISPIHILFIPALSLLALALTPNSGRAQSAPPESDSGILQKSIQQSRPEFKPPTIEIPEIKIEEDKPKDSPASDQKIRVKQFKVDGASIFDAAELEALVNPMAGGELSIVTINALADRITAYYVDRGYLLARAFIPHQEVTDGVVIFKVLEGKFDTFTVQGNKIYQTRDFMARLKPASESGDLKRQTLERALLELNDVHGVKVKSFLKPGAKPGTSDLVLEVEESKPFFISFDADNFGNTFSGRNRMGVSGTVGNLFKFGDYFQMRGIRSDAQQNFISSTYSIPVTDIGTDLRLSYIHADHQLTGNLAVLRGGGESNIISLSATHPVFRTQNFLFNINGGLDFRFFENYLLSTTTSDDEMADVFLGVDGFITDPFRARTFYNARLQQGFREGNVSDPLNSRFLGRGNAFVFSGGLTRYQSAVVMGSYFILKAVGHVTSERVLSADMFAAGGMGTVRGLPLSEISGDNGYMLSAEYVLPFPIKLQVTPETTMDKIISLFAFIDNARAYVRNPQPGERDREITGAGAGFRLNVPQGKDGHPGVSFTFSWGAPVLGNPQTSDGTAGTIYVGGVINY